MVHADHAEKVDVTQWIGQAPSLHACVSDECRHAVPPCMGDVIVVRECERVPAPHECEQLLHEPQPDSSQLTGHGDVLHTCVSDEAGQATPP
jgi:hypothetical protein